VSRSAPLSAPPPVTLLGTLLSKAKI